MMNNTQYFTNRSEYQGCRIPARKPEFLEINKHLAEFSSPNAKEQARQNLGIPDIIKDLDNKIDQKVVNEGDISWDLEPTYGNDDKILSSHVIYQTLMKYVSKENLDETTQQLWSNLILKISDNYNKIEIELNQLYNNLEACINNLRQEFNEHSLSNNLKYDKLIRDYQDLLLHFGELKQFVKDEYLTLYETLYCNINNEQIIPIENKIHQLQLIVDSFLQTSGGTALAGQFGNSEYVGVNQRVLTQALNKIWEKIDSLTGEISNGIQMQVTPQYFMGDEGCTINVSAQACQEGSIFDHIAFYIDDVLLQEADNTRELIFSTHIDDTSEIKCVATIFGIEYETSKVIIKCGKCFLFTGNFESNTEIGPYIINHPEVTIPTSGGLRGDYDIDCLEDSKIYILIEKTIEDQFIRADLNGLEIPFIQETIIINGLEYILFTSINTYNAGTYNIDING